MKIQVLLIGLLAFGPVCGFADDSSSAIVAGSSAQSGREVTPATSQVATTSVDADDANEDNNSNMLDELDPFDPDIDKVLQIYDQDYEEQTGQSAHIDDLMSALTTFSLTSCYRETCPVWAHVIKAEQLLHLFVNGVAQGDWPTSTGRAGHTTPNFDTHPDGRIYDRYTSKKFPGGDYNGLGNMPYVVFIQGGFGIHGTGKSNWPKLGHVASHGCIRVHPDNAFIFNRLVRQYGIANTWVTVD